MVEEATVEVFLAQFQQCLALGTQDGNDETLERSIRSLKHICSLIAPGGEGTETLVQRLVETKSFEFVPSLVSLVKSLDPTLVPRTNATHEGPHARLLSNCLRTLINVSSAFDGRYDAVIQAQGIVPSLVSWICTGSETIVFQAMWLLDNICHQSMSSIRAAMDANLTAAVTDLFLDMASGEFVFSEQLDRIDANHLVFRLLGLMLSLFEHEQCSEQEMTLLADKCLGLCGQSLNKDQDIEANAEAVRCLKYVARFLMTRWESLDGSPLRSLLCSGDVQRLNSSVLFKTIQFLEHGLLPVVSGQETVLACAVGPFNVDIDRMFADATRSCMQIMRTCLSQPQALDCMHLAARDGDLCSLVCRVVLSVKCPDDARENGYLVMSHLLSECVRSSRLTLLGGPQGIEPKLLARLQSDMLDSQRSERTQPPFRLSFEAACLMCNLVSQSTVLELEVLGPKRFGAVIACCVLYAEPLLTAWIHARKTKRSKSNQQKPASPSGARITNALLKRLILWMDKMLHKVLWLDQTFMQCTCRLLSATGTFASVKTIAAYCRHKAVSETKCAGRSVFKEIADTARRVSSSYRVILTAFELHRSSSKVGAPETKTFSTPAAAADQGNLRFACLGSFVVAKTTISLLDQAAACLRVEIDRMTDFIEQSRRHEQDARSLLALLRVAGPCEFKRFESEPA